jgi:Transcription initiation factor IIF, alpha subunit (TFIIF-alpha)
MGRVNKKYGGKTRKVSAATKRKAQSEKTRSKRSSIAEAVPLLDPIVVDITHTSEDSEPEYEYDEEEEEDGGATEGDDGTDDDDEEENDDDDEEEEEEEEEEEDDDDDDDDEDDDEEEEEDEEEELEQDYDEEDDDNEEVYIKQEEDLEIDTEEDKKPKAVLLKKQTGKNTKNVDLDNKGNNTRGRGRPKRCSTTAKATAVASAKSVVRNSGPRTRSSCTIAAAEKGVAAKKTPRSKGKKVTPLSTKARNGRSSNVVPVSLPQVDIATTRDSSTVRDLTSFGFRAAPVASVDKERSQQARSNNSSRLRLVIINGTENVKYIVFRCEPSGEGSNTTSWCEKVISDAIKTSEPWTKRFNVSEQIFNWYENNVLKLNNNGYPIRLFHIPTDDELLQLAKHICHLVTITPRNTERLFVNENDLYWIRNPVVWSDVIGVSKSLAMIRLYRGGIYDGFYKTNEDFILTYFHRGDTANIAELHPSGAAST